jgi:hypothetical protein
MLLLPPDQANTGWFEGVEKLRLQNEVDALRN